MKNCRRRESGGEVFFSITLAAHLALKTCAWGLVRDSRSAALKFGDHVGREGPPFCSQDAVEVYHCSLLAHSMQSADSARTSRPAAAIAPPHWPLPQSVPLPTPPKRRQVRHGGLEGKR